MASITIRNIDESVKKALRIRAAENGWSMEEEVRRLLVNSISRLNPPESANWKAMDGVMLRIQHIVAQAGGLDIPIVEDDYIDFDELFAGTKSENPSRAA